MTVVAERGIETRQRSPLIQGEVISPKKIEPPDTEFKTTPKESSIVKPITFSELVTDPALNASEVIDAIIPEKLLNRNGRQKQVLSPNRAEVYFGTLATLTVRKKEPKQKNETDRPEKKKEKSKPRGEIMLTAERTDLANTTHSLEDAKINHLGKDTEFLLPKFTTSTLTTETRIKITPTGLVKTVIFEPNGFINPLYSQLIKDTPPSITLPPEGPQEEQIVYPLTDAKMVHEEGVVKVVLPATEHLSSVVVTTLEVTRKNVKKNVQILSEGVVFDVNTTTEEGKDALSAEIPPEVQGAIKLNERRHDQLRHDVATGKIAIIVPSLRYEAEGAIAKMNKEDEEKYQKEKAKENKAVAVNKIVSKPNP